MLKYKVEYFLVVGVKSGLRILPVKLRFKILEFLGVLTYYAIKKRRDITNKNLRIAFLNFLYLKKIIYINPFLYN